MAIGDSGTNAGAIRASVSVDTATFKKSMESLVDIAKITATDIQTAFSSLNLSKALTTSLNALKRNMKSLQKEMEAMKPNMNMDKSASSINGVNKELSKLKDNATITGKSVANALNNTEKAYTTTTKKINKNKKLTDKTVERVQANMRSLDTSFNKLGITGQKAGQKIDKKMSGINQRMALMNANMAVYDSNAWDIMNFDKANKGLDKFQKKYKAIAESTSKSPRGTYQTFLSSLPTNQLTQWTELISGALRKSVADVGKGESIINSSMAKTEAQGDKILNTTRRRAQLVDEIVQKSQKLSGKPFEIMDSKSINSSLKAIEGIHTNVDKTGMKSLKIKDTLKSIGTGELNTINKEFGKMIKYESQFGKNYVTAGKYSGTLGVSGIQQNLREIQKYNDSVEQSQIRQKKLLAERQGYIGNIIKEAKKFNMGKIKIEGITEIDTQALKSKKGVDSLYKSLNRLDTPVLKKASGNLRTLSTQVKEVDNYSRSGWQSVNKMYERLNASFTGNKSLRENEMWANRVKNSIGQLNGQKVYIKGFGEIDSTLLKTKTDADALYDKFRLFDTISLRNFEQQFRNIIMGANEGTKAIRTMEEQFQAIQKYKTKYPTAGKYNASLNGASAVQTLAEYKKVEAEIPKIIAELNRLNSMNIRLPGLAGAYQQMLRLEGGAKRVANGLSEMSSASLYNFGNNINTMGNNMKTVATNMDKMEKEAQKAKESVKNTGNASANASKGMGMFARATNLARRALSGIFVIWGFNFAMELIEVSKNAMDSANAIRELGKDMSWTSQQSQSFIDKMRSVQQSYPKIDINETGKQVAEMARTYKLTNKQATDLIETSAVFNSAMAREGRTTRDASLALKDYLDGGTGWKRRMQEIGATPERLKEMGWNGKEGDTDSKIKALDKYLQSRGYDVMAKKIYTLDDAYRALQNSIGSLLGSIGEGLTPTIISCVQAIIQMIGGLKQLGDWFTHDTWGKFTFDGLKMVGMMIVAYASVIKLKNGFILLKESLEGLRFMLATNPFALAVAGAVALLYILYKIGQSMGWWKNWQDILKQISDTLTDLQHGIVNIRPGAMFAGFSVAVGGAIALLKIFAKNGESAIGKVATKIRDLIRKFVLLGKEEDKVNKKEKENEKTTGKTGSGTGNVEKGKVRETIAQNLRNQAVTAVKVATTIAIAFGLAMEAIALLWAVMMEVSLVGQSYKSQEGNVKKGIEGITVIAPLMTALIIPIVALMYLINRYAPEMSALKANFKASALIIAEAMGLVAEVIAMIIPSMFLLGVIGSNINVGNVNKGVQTVTSFAPILAVLVPPIAVLMVVMNRMGVMASTVAKAGLSSAVAIASVLGLVAEAIGMIYPSLYILSYTGQTIDVSSVQSGVNAINSMSGILRTLLPPIIVLFTVMSIIGSGAIEPMAVGFIASAIAIAGILTLVAEAIGMMYPSLWILSTMGQKINAGLVSKGVTVINLVGTAIRSIVNALNNLPKGLGGLGQNILNIINLAVIQVAIVQIAGIARFINTQLANTTVNPAVISNLAKITSGLVGVVNAIRNLSIALMAGALFTGATALLGKYYTSVQGIVDFAKKITASAGNIAGINVGAITQLTSVTGAVRNTATAINGLTGALVGHPIPDNFSGLLNRLYSAVQAVMAFSRRVGGAGDKGTGGNVAGVTTAVRQLQVAINSMVTTVNSGAGRLRSASSRLGNAFRIGVANGVRGTAGIVRREMNGVSSAINIGRTASDRLGGAFSNLRSTTSTLVSTVNSLATAIRNLPSSKTIGITLNISQKGNASAGLMGKVGLSSLPTGTYTATTGGAGGGISSVSSMLSHWLGFAGLKIKHGSGFGGFAGTNNSGRSFDSVAQAIMANSQYQYYYNSKNGGNIEESLRSGAFNCYDGSLILMALASMYGLKSEMRGMMINGDGHAYTVINGKVYDATAMQTMGRRKAPGVHYAGTGNNSKKDNKDKAPTNNYTVEVQINGDIYGEKDLESKIKEGVEKALINLINPSKGTGM